MGTIVNKTLYLKKSMPEPNTGCWIWLGTMHSTGYGNGSHIKPDGKVLKLAHRVSYYIFKGDFDPSLSVCHTCDNRWCVNPDHLFLGTRSDNHKDMVKKNRVRYGENHRASKLTNAFVIEIRERYKNGGCTYYSLAEEYGVDHSTIYGVVKGKLWRRVKKGLPT